MAKKRRLKPVIVDVPTPSFFDGMARILDLGATMSRIKMVRDPRRSSVLEDIEALQGDWERIGQNYWNAIEESTEDN